MAIEENDVVELDYTGRELHTGEVFESTIQKEYKEHTKPVIIVGRGHILPSIEKALIGREVNDSFKLKLEPEEAFGKKRMDLLIMVPSAEFARRDIEPVPGLRLIIDDRFCIVRSVSGGRVLVDFNHPLAGKQVEYELKVLKVLKETKEKATAFVRYYLPKAELEFHQNRVVVKSKERPANWEFVEKELKEAFGLDAQLALN